MYAHKGSMKVFSSLMFPNVLSCQDESWSNTEMSAKGVSQPPVWSALAEDTQNLLHHWE